MSRPRESGVDAGLGASAPDVGDGERQGVGGISRLGHRVEPQDPGHHGPDLRLVGTPVAGHRGLDLAGGVQRDGQPAARRADDRDRRGLRGAHHGAHVVLGEDPLDRHGVGLHLVEPPLDTGLDGEQTGDEQTESVQLAALKALLVDELGG